MAVSEILLRKISHTFLNLLINLFTMFYIASLWLNPRFISIGQLNTLLHLHLQPINHVVFMVSYYLTVWDILS